MIDNQEEINISKLKQTLVNIRLDYSKKYLIFLDGDRTLCNLDTSRLLNKYADLDLSPIKRGFKKFGYSYQGFYNMASCYSEIEIELYKKLCKKIAYEVDLYPGVGLFLEFMKDYANIFLLTSGIKEIWRCILDRYKLNFVHFLAGTRIDLDDYLIGRQEKGEILRYFKHKDRILVAIGDSDVDCIMLQNADIAGIVVNHRNNEDLIQNLSDHKNLFQISYSWYKHRDIHNIDYMRLGDYIIKFKLS